MLAVTNSTYDDLPTLMPIVSGSSWSWGEIKPPRISNTTMPPPAKILTDTQVKALADTFRSDSQKVTLNGKVLDNKDDKEEIALLLTQCGQRLAQCRHLLLSELQYDPNENKEELERLVHAYNKEKTLYNMLYHAAKELMED
jgi:hypothetical protein